MKNPISIIAIIFLLAGQNVIAETIFTDISNTIDSRRVKAIEDVNGDGWADLLHSEGISLNMGVIVDGKPTFELITDGLDFVGDPLSHSIFIDIDGDGDQDLIASESFSGGRLYRNDSCGRELRFIDITEEAGIEGKLNHEQNHLALADIDGDGDLDLYLVEGWPYGNRGILYRNDTDITGIHFTDITSASNVVAPEASRTVLFNDFDGDGDPDLYLGSFGWHGANKFYLNVGDIDGDGITNFQDATLASGLMHILRENGGTSGDIDNDGDIDIIQATGYNFLVYKNIGDVNHDGIVDFIDYSRDSGLFERCPHGVGLGDIDNDGDLDIADASWFYSPLKIFSNDGSGYFTNTTRLSGIGYLTYGVQTLFSDIDNDGDLDLWMNKLFMNNTNNQNYLKVRLLGEGLNRDAIGAKIRVWTSGAPKTPENLKAYREVTAGTSFFSSEDHVIELGLAAGEYDIEATFRSGTVVALDHVETGQEIKIAEGNSVVYPDYRFCGAKAIDIDIKPGGFPNSINRKNKGNVPVAIYGDEDFDVTDIDPTTVTFAESPLLSIGSGIEDVNSDSFWDVVFHFKTQDLDLPITAEEACVVGQTIDGQKFYGCDSVRVIK